MSVYPKHVLTIQEQLKAYIDAGLEITSRQEVINALDSIGYYRLRGYCFQFYNNTDKSFQPGTKFSDILSLYQFDTELSHLLLSMTSAIEVSLRSRLSNALLIDKNALALFAPEYFEDKKSYWKNTGTLSNEIARSNDVFIKHNFQNHDGLIPVWAAVEVMSFGNLSKTIKNLKKGPNTPSSELLSHYQYKSAKGKLVNPSHEMFSSWTQSVSILRNICAHNGRIYNRTISTTPQIPDVDKPSLRSGHNGLYQIVLAMKYLKPADTAWNTFVSNLEALFSKYKSVIDLTKINFPSDWKDHLIV